MAQLTPLAERIWDMKYRLHEGADAKEATPQDTFRRVANALARPEVDAQRWAEAFYDILKNQEFLPAGRILAGAGTDRAVTLFNCFVMGRIPDDMGGIFDHLREAALTMQHGGGIGYDFSTLRPQGAPVKGVGADASGPLSFMDVWDAMCRTIMSAGSRRGAMMATLRCDHPDIEAFVDAKRTPGRLRMFNLSVLATDDFMAAVDRDDDWPLVFEGEVARTIKARDLWGRMMRATYDSAEPGVIFIDRINQQNNLNYVETIYATNPCGEQPLPPYGACLLGSINLARLVRGPFTDGARLDTERLAQIVPVAVRLLDNVTEVSRFALPAQEEEAKSKRRIGLGITGLADALIFCGVRYDSDEALALASTWLKAIQVLAYTASSELAEEKGAFPLFDATAYLKQPNLMALEPDVRARIASHGMRNALLTSIAPTGTISLFANNISSGIEPVFAYRYERRVRMPDGTTHTQDIADFAYEEFRRLKGADADLPGYFVDAHSLAPAAHLAMQAAAQVYVDSSISKTINCPEDICFEDFQDVYLQAYALGCKGCTTYRPNPVTGHVLATLGGGEGADGREGQVVYMTEPLDRPVSLTGRTYKLRWPESDHAIYVTINDIVQDGRQRPFEIFINSKNMEHYAWTVALTRMISAVFRRGGDVSFVVEELKAVFDPRGGQWVEGRYVPSLLAAIGDVIGRHMVDIKFLPAPSQSPGAQPRGALSASNRGCPACGQPGLMRSENCDLCVSCGYSRCS